MDDNFKRLLSQLVSDTKIEIDRVDSTTTYIGEAALGVSKDKPLWKITKITTSGGATELLTPSGENANKVWDDRASYTYL